MGVCDDGADARGELDEGARAAGGGAGGHVQRAEVANTLWAYATIEREQYLRDKLADCVQTSGIAVSET